MARNTRLLPMSLQSRGDYRDRQPDRDELLEAMMRQQQSESSRPVYSHAQGLARVANTSLTALMSKWDKDEEKAQHKKKGDELMAALLGMIDKPPQVEPESERLAKALNGETISPAGDKSQPRGIRNNNPGNIEAGPFADRHGATGTDGRFAQFENPGQGIDAMRSLLGSYQDRGLNTVEGMVNRWAPPSENDSNSYSAQVASAMGVEPNQPVDLNDPRMSSAMIQAMIQRENGQMPYGPEMFGAGGPPTIEPAGGPQRLAPQQAQPPQMPPNMRQALGPNVGGAGGSYIDMMRQYQQTGQLPGSNGMMQGVPGGSAVRPEYLNQAAAEARAVTQMPLPPPGNAGRPALSNADGSFSTEETITIEGPQGWVNIPTIVGGQRVGERAAVDLYRNGQNAAVGGPFGTVQEAEAAAQARSDQIGQFRGPQAPPAPQASQIAPGIAPQPYDAQGAPQGQQTASQELLGGFMPQEEMAMLRTMYDNGGMDQADITRYVLDKRDAYLESQKPKWDYKDGQWYRIDSGGPQAFGDPNVAQAKADPGTVEFTDGRKQTFDLGTPDGRAAWQQALAQGAIEVRTPATQVNIGTGEQTPGRKKADEEFGKEYQTWITGGFAEADTQIQQLGGVAAKLTQGEPLTGPAIGQAYRMTSPQTFALMYPEAAAAMDDVTQVIQGSLRATLGAQFTADEGERLIARTYNPSLPPEVNAVRVQRLQDKLRAAAQAKQAAANYFAANGTLTGYEGRMPTFADLEPDDSPSDSTQGGPQPQTDITPGTTAINPQTGERIRMNENGEWEAFQ